MCLPWNKGDLASTPPAARTRIVPGATFNLTTIGQGGDVHVSASTLISSSRGSISRPTTKQSYSDHVAPWRQVPTSGRTMSHPNLCETECAPNSPGDIFPTHDPIAAAQTAEEPSDFLHQLHVQRAPALGVPQVDEHSRDVPAVAKIASDRRCAASSPAPGNVGPVNAIGPLHRHVPRHCHQGPSPRAQGSTCTRRHRGRHHERPS